MEIILFIKEEHRLLDFILEKIVKDGDCPGTG